MRSKQSAVFVLMSCIAVMCLMPAAAQNNQVPRLLSYQGHLVVDGQPITGSQDVTFAFYDRANGGSPLAGWQEQRTILVERGVFSVLLGEQNNIPTDVFEENQDVYLSISVDGSEFRVPLASTPFSFRAGYADRAAEAERIGDLAVSTDMLEDGAVTSEKLASGAAVLNLNDLTGGVELVAGDNVRIQTDSGDGRIEISAEGDDDDDDDDGLSSVSTDETLVGDGTPDDELGLASGIVVRSLNGQTDDVSLVPGDNVRIDEDDGEIRISAQTGNGDDGAGVSSLNNLTGEVRLVGGRQIELEEENQNIIIHRTGNGGPPSSLRYKENVEPLQEALTTVDNLQGVRFTWKEDGRADIGLIAEEVVEILPEVVFRDAAGEQVEGINYDSLVALLVEAIKEQHATISGLERRLETQEALLQRLVQVVDDLQDTYRD